MKGGQQCLAHGKHCVIMDTLGFEGLSDLYKGNGTSTWQVGKFLHYAIL